MPALKKQFLPSVLTDHPTFKGACVQECVAGSYMGIPPENSLAHTHVYPKDPFVGWICFKDILCLLDKQVMLHEMAHLLTAFHHIHDGAWRKKLLELGGSLEGYTFEVGKFGYTVPCLTEQCSAHDGRDPEERMTPHQKKSQDHLYAEVLRLQPSILDERDRLVNYLDRCPIMKEVSDPQRYIRNGLASAKTWDDYFRLVSGITVPLEVMY